MTALRSAAEWQTLIPGLVVHDPDGWDRSNFKESWAEPITVEEYQRRAAFSTCSGDFGAITDYMAGRTTSDSEARS